MQLFYARQEKTVKYNESLKKIIQSRKKVYYGIIRITPGSPGAADRLIERYNGVNHILIWTGGISNKVYKLLFHVNPPAGPPPYMPIHAGTKMTIGNFYDYFEPLRIIHEGKAAGPN